MPQEAPPLIKTQLRNSRFGVDRVGRFAEGPHYGPVLEPIHIHSVHAHVQINPLIQQQSEQHDKLYLEWNMLFPSAQCQSSDGVPLTVRWSQSHGDEPATFPRLTQLRLVSDMFPWTIHVIASNPDLGVTCGEMVARIDDELHRSTLQQDYEALPPARKRAVQAAYKKNRSREDGVPGRQLTPAMLRLDWLGGDTFFGGLRENKTLVRYVCRDLLPCTFELVRVGKHPGKVEQLASTNEGDDEEGE
ncbi:hypothetical protein FB45DRAFT_753824 [Roridomyces roridus]|uniref:DUF6699 domain-containing protein n=1 Tax=Roridomyces roridus TaxID=1738132 RepID=A0AAD7BHR0_9AGAR|nr:hypothetical protein FB45DRAFT_753824 [Roridomyces roridus]